MRLKQNMMQQSKCTGPAQLHYRRVVRQNPAGLLCSSKRMAPWGEVKNQDAEGVHACSRAAAGQSFPPAVSTSKAGPQHEQINKLHEHHPMQRPNGVNPSDTQLVFFSPP